MFLYEKGGNKMANLTEKAKVYLENFYNGPKIESFDPIELKAIQFRRGVRGVNVYRGVEFSLSA
jgi:hypothetical protein